MPEFKTNVLPQRLYNCGESKVDTQIKSGGMFLTVSVSSPMPTFFLNVFSASSKMPSKSSQGVTKPSLLRANKLFGL